MRAQSHRIQRIAWGDPEFDNAKHLEFHIYGMANKWTTIADMEAGEITHYWQWERSSVFYVTYELDPQTGDERPIAIIRCLRYDPTMGLNSFSTLRDFRCYQAKDGKTQNYLFANWNTFFLETDPRHIAEATTEAVLRGYRHLGVIQPMWRQFLRDSHDDGVRIWVMAMSLPLFHLYKTVLPNALQAIGQFIPDYLGADSIPAMMALDHPDVTDAIAAYDPMEDGTFPVLSPRPQP